MFGKGISKESVILELAVNNGLIQKAGAWYSMNDTKLGQGEVNTRNYLENNPEITESLEKMLREKFKLSNTFAVTT